jgi:hypothetical protein
MSVAEAKTFQLKEKPLYQTVTLRGRIVVPGPDQCRDAKTGRSCLGIADFGTHPLVLCLMTLKHECASLDTGPGSGEARRMAVCTNADDGPCCSMEPLDDVIVTALFVDNVHYEFQGPVCAVRSSDL